MSDTTIVAPGVERFNCFWGYRLEGRKDELLRGGFARPKWFLDGRRKRHGRIMRTVYAEHAGVPVKCTQPARGPCIVLFFTGKEERSPVEQAALRARSLTALFGQGHPYARLEMARTATEDADFRCFLHKVSVHSW